MTNGSDESVESEQPVHDSPSGPHEEPSGDLIPRILRDVLASEIVAHQIVGRFSGPLPPPAALQRYEEALPGAAERIVHMAELEQHHRHDLEKGQLRSDTRLGAQGLWFAFILALVVLTGSMWLISRGHAVTGGILVTLDLVALVTAFILGRSGDTTKQSAPKAG